MLTNETKSETEIERFSQPLYFLVLLVALLPIIFVGIYTYQNAANVPFNDQWGASVPLALKTKAHQVEFKDLTVQQADHRHFFTNVVTVIVASLTPWDLRWEAYVNWVLACLNLVILLRLAYRDEPRALVIVLIPFAALVFSFRLYTGWLSGFLNSWHFYNLFLLLSLHTLKYGKVGWRSLGLTAFFALCAMYSFGTGVSVWILLVPALWMLHYRKWTYWLFWLGASALGYYSYFANYDFKRNSADFSDPLGIVQFCLRYVGNPFVEQDKISVIVAGWIGAIGLLLWISNLVYLKKLVGVEWSKLAVWITFVLLVLGTAFLTALGRSSKSELVPLNGRYVALSMLFWMSLLVLGSMSGLHMLSGTRLSIGQHLLLKGNMLCLTILAGNYLFANYRALQVPPPVTFEEQACVVAYPVTRDYSCFTGIYPNLDNVGQERRKARILERVIALDHQNLSIFAEYSAGAIMPPYQFNNAAQQATQIGDTTKAIELYNRGLELYPDNVDLYLQLGEFYVSLRRPQLALSNFNRALRLDSHNIDVLTQRGLFYMDRNQYNNALADFQHILMIDPTNTIAQEQIEKIEQESGS